MSGKHTLGPWAIGDRGNIEAPDPFCGRVIVANAEKSSGVIPDSERKANAALIAAAPELLSALKAIDALYMHWWDIVDPHGAITMMPDSVEKLEAIHKTAQAAIAKATMKP